MQPRMSVVFAGCLDLSYTQIVAWEERVGTPSRPFRAHSASKLTNNKTKPSGGECQLMHSPTQLCAYVNFVFSID
eukprot:958969-Amphidinium_carterae.1